MDQRHRPREAAHEGVVAEDVLFEGDGSQWQGSEAFGGAFLGDDLLVGFEVVRYSLWIGVLHYGTEILPHPCICWFI